MEPMSQPAPRSITPSGRGRGVPTYIRFALVAVGLIIVGIFFYGMFTHSSPSDAELGAKDVCHQATAKVLRSPASADYSAETVTHVGDAYTVTGTVDSDNAFGASLRSRYVCTATHAGGDNWQAVKSSLLPG